MESVVLCESDQSTAGIGVCAGEVGMDEGALPGKLHTEQDCGGQSDM